MPVGDVINATTERNCIRKEMSNTYIILNNRATSIRTPLLPSDLKAHPARCLLHKYEVSFSRFSEALTRNTGRQRTHRDRITRTTDKTQYKRASPDGHQWPALSAEVH